MLKLNNRTKFEAANFFLGDEEGAEHLIVVVKATYKWDGEMNLEIAKEQQPVEFGDVYYGEPGKSSVRYASDAVPAKPTTDVCLNGYAYNLNQKPFVDAYLKVGPLEKTIRVFGQRNWMHLGVVVTKSSATSFSRIPLIYENAYGGEDKTGEDEKNTAAHLRNPVGKGFALRRDINDLDGVDLPHLEDPEDLIRGWNDRPAPACFGFIAPNWQPRLKFAGTFDEDWDRDRKPFLPENFDRGFFNASHPDLIAAEPFEGGEAVEMRNVHPRKEKVRFNLPKIRPRISVGFMGEERIPSPMLDTLVFEPEADRFTMLWRASLNCDKKNWAVENIAVDLEKEDR